MRPMASLYASVDPAREQLARQEKEAKVNKNLYSIIILYAR
jgi:hypothetical protein